MQFLPYTFNHFLWILPFHHYLILVLSHLYSSVSLLKSFNPTRGPSTPDLVILLFKQIHHWSSACDQTFLDWHRVVLLISVICLNHCSLNPGCPRVYLPAQWFCIHPYRNWHRKCTLCALHLSARKVVHVSTTNPLASCQPVLDQQVFFGTNSVNGKWTCHSASSGTVSSIIMFLE